MFDITISMVLYCFFPLIRAIVTYEFSKRIPMLDQIGSGLQLFGILDSIKKHPQLLEPVFTESSFFKPNADTFLGNMMGNFSEHGSNDKLLEIDVYKYFTDFIEDCEYSGE
jgi:hypothetical protein